LTAKQEHTGFIF